MTDRSLPVGDRDDPPPYRPGPAMARAALNTAGQPAPLFVDQVVALGRENGWAVIRPGPGSDPGAPTVLFVRGDVVAAAHVGSGQPGFRGDEWGARLRRAGVEWYRWSPRDGLTAAEAALREAQ